MKQMHEWVHISMHAQSYMANHLACEISDKGLCHKNSKDPPPSPFQPKSVLFERQQPIGFGQNTDDTIWVFTSVSCSEKAATGMLNFRKK